MQDEKERFAILYCRSLRHVATQDVDKIGQPSICMQCQRYVDFAGPPAAAGDTLAVAFLFAECLPLPLGGCSEADGADGKRAGQGGTGSTASIGSAAGARSGSDSASVTTLSSAPPAAAGASSASGAAAAADAAAAGSTASTASGIGGGAGPVPPQPPPPRNIPLSFDVLSALAASPRVAAEPEAKEASTEAEADPAAAAAAPPTWYNPADFDSQHGGSASARSHNSSAKLGKLVQGSESHLMVSCVQT